MILITSTVKIEANHWEDAKRLAQDHVERSRKEGGCISHNWFEHPEESQTLFFFEQWQDQDAIKHHFAQPYSQHLADSFSQWATTPSTLKIMPVAEIIEHKLG